MWTDVVLQQIWDFGSGKLMRQLHASHLGFKVRSTYVRMWRREHSAGACVRCARSAQVYGCCWVSPNTVLAGGTNTNKAFTIDTEHDSVRLYNTHTHTHTHTVL